MNDPLLEPIVQALSAVDPLDPARNRDDFERRCVEGLHPGKYGGEVRRLRSEIESAVGGQHMYLFSGSLGSGKSTELRRLADDLRGADYSRTMARCRSAACWRLRAVRLPPRLQRRGADAVGRRQALSLRRRLSERNRSRDQSRPRPVLPDRVERQRQELQVAGPTAQRRRAADVRARLAVLERGRQRLPVRPGCGRRHAAAPAPAWRWRRRSSRWL